MCKCPFLIQMCAYLELEESKEELPFVFVVLANVFGFLYSKIIEFPIKNDL